MEGTSERAERLRQDGHLAEAVALALEVWRQTRSAEVAEALELLTAEALRSDARGAPAKSKDEFQAAYLERAKEPDAVSTGWLASHLDRLVSVEASSAGILDADYALKKHRAFFERLAMLPPRVPDPRIAKALSTFLAAAPYSAWDRGGAKRIYGPVLELMVAAADPRQAPVLEDLLANPRAERAATRDELAETLPPVIDRLRAIPVRLSEAERAAWRRLVPEKPQAPHGADGEALWAAVRAEPDDDDVRLVYADWLQEHGDPRGELILLQVRAARGKASPSDERRARALLKEHRDEWLGELALVLTGTKFERGFLDEASVAQNAAAPEQAWARAPGSPLLATLRSLEQGRSNARHYQSLVCSPHATNLRRVDVSGKPLLDALCDGPPRAIEELVFTKLVGKDGLRRVAASAAFPRLERLHVPVRADVARVFEQLRASGLCERLARLSVSAAPACDLPALLGELKRGLGDRSLPAALTFEYIAARCELRAAGPMLEAFLRDELGMVIDAFLEARFPLASLTVSVGATVHERLAAALKRVVALRRAGVEVKVVPDAQ